MIVEHLAGRKNEGQNEEKDFDFKSLLVDTDKGRVAGEASVHLKEPPDSSPRIVGGALHDSGH